MKLIAEIVVLMSVGALLVVAPVFVATLVLCIILVVLIDMYHDGGRNGN